MNFSKAQKSVNSVFLFIISVPAPGGLYNIKFLNLMNRLPHHNSPIRHKTFVHFPEGKSQINPIDWPQQQQLRNGEQGFCCGSFCCFMRAILLKVRS